MSQPHKAGKTAPGLVQDIYKYDPAHPPDTGRNLLSDIPPVFPEGYQGPQDFISPWACKHEYVTKKNQTFVPQPGHREGAVSPPRVSAVCKKCRYHVELRVSSNPGIGQSNEKWSHLHHLVYQSGCQKGGDPPEEITPRGQVAESFHYECSYFKCSCKVSVRIVSPVFDSGRVELLTNQELIRARMGEAVEAHPAIMEKTSMPDAAKVLSTLHTYLGNTLYNPEETRSPTSTNKGFMSCFGLEGTPCQSLLEFLGFNREQHRWHPPRPTSPWDGLPYQDEERIFLDDAVYELLVLMEQHQSGEKKQNWSDPLVDFLQALEALEYLDPRSIPPRECLMADIPIFYEDLGVIEGMFSSAIVEAYSRQASQDPANAPLYLQSLKSISHIRGGDEFIDKAVKEANSKGQYARDEIVQAYGHFGLEHDDSQLTDESIIEKFTSSSQNDESRKQLRRIAYSRRSDRIKSVLEDQLSTAEQARVFLGVNSDTPDDFIISAYTVKANDSSSDKRQARRALELIGEKQNSDLIRQYLETGEITSTGIDVGAAYSLLGIPDPATDDSGVHAAYSLCLDEALKEGSADRVEKVIQALTMIANDRNSSGLSAMVPDTDADSSLADRNMAEWPVGLTNIGNTCYLNSLLQFYFSVRPFRDTVLNFENFKMDLNDPALNDQSSDDPAWNLPKKQVASRKVTYWDVEHSQRFVRELRTLFQHMITSSESYVTPEKELARLILKSETSQPTTAGLGELHGAPIQGPQGPPQSTPTNESKELAPLGSETPQRASDVDSEATLVSEGSKNETPTQSEFSEMEVDAPPTESVQKTAPPSQPQNETPTQSEFSEMEVDAPPTESVRKTAPPSQPPPVPPRPRPESELDFRDQQDVKEAIENLLFKSECAMRPSAIAPDGEQIDPVKDLFYGQSKTYTSRNGDTSSIKEQRWCDVQINVISGPRNIYAALDAYFDMQQTDTGLDQYLAISKAPPVLQLHVPRAQYDKILGSYKVNHHLGLEETIYLDRYMECKESSEMMRQRRQGWDWRNRLADLEARRAELLRRNETDDLDMPGLFEESKQMLQQLSSIDTNPLQTTELDQLSQASSTELKDTEQEIKDTQTEISKLFMDYKLLPYRLYAVFFHQGTTTSGHYWVYIFDFAKNVWRKYNDNRVTELRDTREIFEEPRHKDSPSPYFVVYVNEKMKDRLTDPVCRQIAQTPEEATPPATTDETGDVNMSQPDDGTNSNPSGTGENTHTEDTEQTSEGSEGSSGWSHQGTDKRDVQW